MRYLNLGCGSHYSLDPIWTNLDFTSSGKGVIAHNLLQGIPYPDETFDVVYHSHVLEHFSKNDGLNFLLECQRVIKPGGIIRIAIPDLEQITRNYLHFLESGVDHLEDENNWANYSWIMLEMFDQTVRNFSGGEMGKYLFQEQIPNEEFVYQRIGEEGRYIRNDYLNTQKNTSLPLRTWKNDIISALRKIKHLKRHLRKPSVFEKIGTFRLQGEIHQWMYDRYSLKYILNKLGYEQIAVKDAFTSYIPRWGEYNLDGKNEIVRKPDSLFIEARKK